MLKYVTTAVALKCFSSTPITRSLYRRLGNELGDRRRRGGVMPGYYLERVKRTLRVLREYGLVRHGDTVFELGTGWLHWEALTLRLFIDIEAVLFDVWDNRQLGGLKNYLTQLGPMLNNVELGLSSAQRARAQAVIDSVARVQSFDELYRLLDFRYVVDADGSLRQFANESFRLVVSGGVLEHVKREALPGLVAEMHRVLEPGGWALHSIDTSDHLSHYDSSVSKKKYLSFSEGTWKRLFENEVQYINRVQRGDWLKLFEAAGFELIEEDSRHVDITGLKLAMPYRSMAAQDLASTVVRAAFKKREFASRH